MRPNAHAVPELSLAAGAALQISRFACGANILVLHSAFQRAAALAAIVRLARAGLRAGAVCRRAAFCAVAVATSGSAVFYLIVHDLLLKRS